MESQRELFCTDALQMIDALEHALRRTENDSYAVHQSFRYAHSLRSQAEYLGFSGFAAAAERLEDELSLARQSGSPVDPEGGSPLRAELQRIASQDTGHDDGATPAAKPAAATPAIHDESSHEGLFDAVCADIPREQLDRWIQSVDTRGEKVFWLQLRLTEPDEFQRQRRYLLLHRLETAMTVAAHSGLDTPLYRDWLGVLLSTNRDRKCIETQLAVGGVDDISIQQLSNQYLRRLRQPHAAYQPGLLQTELSIRISGREYERVLMGIHLLSEGSSLAGNIIAADLLGIIRHSGAVQASDLLFPLEKAAHRTAEAQGKMVRCHTTRDDIRLPAPAVSVLREALLHIVRNAVDHGIEAPPERRRQNKAAEGNIWISLQQHQSYTELRVGDDGRGIEAREGETETDLLNRVTRPGFSTRIDAAAGSISGRGVGLDVVRHSIERLLHGSMRIQRTPHTEFILQIPTDFQLISVIIVESLFGGIRAVPAFCVLDRVPMEAARYTRTPAGDGYYRYKENTLPVYDFLETGEVKGSDNHSAETAAEALLIVDGHGGKTLLPLARAIAEEGVVLGRDTVFSEVLQQSVQLWNPWTQHAQPLQH